MEGDKEDRYLRPRDGNNNNNNNRSSGGSRRSRSSTGGTRSTQKRHSGPRPRREGETMHRRTPSRGKESVAIEMVEQNNSPGIDSPLMTSRYSTGIDTASIALGESKMDSPGQDEGARVPPSLPSAMKTQAELLNFVNQRRNKKAFFRELLRHIVFTALFIAILFMQRNVFESYVMNTALNTAFVSQTMDSTLQPFPKTFLDVGEWGELRDWLVSVLGATLDNNQFYSGQPYTSSTDYEYVENANRLLGGVRLKQLRVIPQSCDVDGTPVTCYPLYHSSSTRATDPFGPPDDPQKYQYQQSDQCVSQYIIGNNLGLLEGPGYIVDIDLYSNFTDRINELIADSWFDISTRAIIITMNFYNIHLSGHVTVLYLVVEMPPGGTVYPNFVMKTWRIKLYTTSLDWFRFAMELIFLILLAVNLIAELKQIYDAVRKSGFRGYMRSLWNLFEIANLLLFGITVGMYVNSVLDGIAFQFNLPRVKYFCELENLAAGALNFYNINAANIILTVFHTFKFLQLNRRLYVLWKTLRHAGTDLLGFLFIFLIFTLAFLFMGWISFGPDTPLFNTFSNSFATCWAFVMGNAPDYNTLSNSNRVLGPAFFALFTIFVFFILANMFIAIISNSFDAVQEGQKKDLKLSQEIEKTLMQLVAKVKLLMGPKEQKPKHIMLLLQNLENPEILAQPEVTLEDYKRAIGKDATDADAHELKTWFDKLRKRSANKAHQSGDEDESPVFTSDEEEIDDDSEEIKIGTATLHSGDFEKVFHALNQLNEQMLQVQQNLQALMNNNNNNNNNNQQPPVVQ